MLYNFGVICSRARALESSWVVLLLAISVGQGKHPTVHVNIVDVSMENLMGNNELINIGECI
jgi:hypothetical protein